MSLSALSENARAKPFSDARMVFGGGGGVVLRSGTRTRESLTPM